MSEPQSALLLRKQLAGNVYIKKNLWKTERKSSF